MKTSPRVQLELLAQNTAFGVLLVAAACLAIYLLKDVKLQWDITQNQRNSLSQASRDILAKMAGPITITAYVRPQDKPLRELQAFIAEFVSSYQRVKPDIDLTFVDTREQPKQAAAANVRAPVELVVSYQGREEHFTSFAEQEMANLLMRLLRSRERVIMYLDGHGEPSLAGQKNFDLGDFGNQLQTKGFQLQALNLAIAQEVPDNAAVLVIAAPRATVLKGEAEKIKRYLDRGGALFWLIDEGKLHGLEPLAAYLGLRLPPGIVVDPAGQQAAGSATIAIGLADGFHPIIAEGPAFSVLPYVRPLVLDPESRGWRATSLVQAGQGGWVETDMERGARFDADVDLKGPVTVVAALERDLEGKPQRAVVAGGSSFLSNTFLGNPGNLDLGVNILNWLSADEALITIQPRARMDSALALSGTANALVLVGFLILLPAALLFAGGMIWWRRRRA